MGFPLYTERARELLLGAQEDLREALREVDDMEVTDAISELIEEIDDLLDWEDLS